MKTIKLTDKEARISKIETDADGLITVSLVWGGPNDNQMEAFDIDQMGGVMSYGTNGNAGRSGWVILDGMNPGWNVGDIIPLKK